MTPSFEMRCAEAMRLLARKEIDGWKTVPGTYRFLWSHGLNLRPPHFATWEANFFLRGGTTGVLFGTLTGLFALITREVDEALLRAAGMALLWGVGHGFVIAARYKRQAEEHELPHWDQLCKPADAFD